MRRALSSQSPLDSPDGRLEYRGLASLRCQLCIEFVDPRLLLTRPLDDRPDQRLVVDRLEPVGISLDQLGESGLYLLGQDPELAPRPSPGSATTASSRCATRRT